MSDRCGENDHFEMLVDSGETYLTVGDLVTRATAELVNGGQHFNAVTLQNLSRYQ